MAEFDDGGSEAVLFAVRSRKKKEQDESKDDESQGDQPVQPVQRSEKPDGSRVVNTQDRTDPGLWTAVFIRSLLTCMTEERDLTNHGLE